MRNRYWDGVAPGVTLFFSVISWGHLVKNMTGLKAEVVSEGLHS